MARPRIFISSTFFDMRTLRDDMDRFVRDHGYEPVRHERGHISYGAEERPEHYAFREIDLCDILICIIGGKYGTSASDGSGSITQKELRTALERGKQVYIFIDSNVYHEYRFFLANKGSISTKYTAVDNPKVHEFIEEIHAATKGNPIFTFSVSSEIMQLLQEQWAGLFQRLLQENAAKQQTALIEELQRSLATVGQLVHFLSEQNKAGKTAIDEILFANHPLFAELKRQLNSPYRLYFTNISELEEWLIKARGYTKSEVDDPTVPEGFYEWFKFLDAKDKRRLLTIQISSALFSDEGTLKPMMQADWKDEYLSIDESEVKKSGSFNDMDDEIPF